VLARYNYRELAERALNSLNRTLAPTIHPIVPEVTYKPHQLPAVFGEEIGNRILASEKGTFKDPGGKNIVIDDPGMSGYYDGIFKQVLEEQAAKRGGGKASRETVSLGEEAGESLTDEVHFLPVNPRMKEPWPLFAGAPPGLTGGNKEEEKKSKLRDFLKKGGA